MNEEAKGPEAKLPSATPARNEDTVLRPPRDPDLAAPGDQDAPASGSAPLDGARAGDYVLERVLAEGGFGVVLRAAHAESGAPAAVKILHAELAAYPDVLLRFEREVDTLRRIRHPGVVDILDFGYLADGRPYFAMELLAGVTLEQRLLSRGRLPADEALAILEPICSALEAAHAQGIIHRDIKPSNVFLCGQGARERVLLLDFGIAKLLDAPGPSLTSSRHVLGTPAYISPEQLLNQPVDPRTDVYGLGALLYGMLTGAPPFMAIAYPALRHLHLHATPPRPSARAPVSQAFDAVVLRAMSKDRTARQPDVAAFLAQVRAAADQARRAGAPPLPRGGAPSRAPLRSRRALGLHVEVLADADALEAPEEPFLRDFESILPAALDELAPAGFTPVTRTGTSALLAAHWPALPAPGELARAGAVIAALALHERLLARPGRDPRVRVRLCLHAGEILSSEAGALVGGDLLDLPAWVPEDADPGVYASPAILAGLDAAAHAFTHGGAPSTHTAIPLLRLAGPGPGASVPPPGV